MDDTLNLPTGSQGSLIATRADLVGQQVVHLPTGRVGVVTNVTPVARLTSGGLVMDAEVLWTGATTLDIVGVEDLQRVF